MFDFMFVAQAIGVIEKYFNEEASEEDFWKVTKESYPNLEKDFCFMIDPQKLKDIYVEGAETLVVTEEEKNSLLKGFKVIHKYSNTLPEDAQLNERMLYAKSLFPSVFFDEASSPKGCKLISIK